MEFLFSGKGEVNNFGSLSQYENISKIYIEVTHRSHNTVGTCREPFTADHVFCVYVITVAMTHTLQAILMVLGKEKPAQV
jgi:hypothetical protein